MDFSFIKNLNQQRTNLSNNKKEIYVLIIYSIISFVCSFIYFLFFNFLKRETIYQTEFFSGLIPYLLMLILYCFLGFHFIIFLRKKFGLINSSIDLIKQFFKIFCPLILWFIPLNIIFPTNVELRKEELFSIFLYGFITCLIFYSIHFVVYKLIEVFNNKIFKKIIYITLNALLTFFTLEIASLIITHFDISKFSIIFIVPLIFTCMFGFQFFLINEILYTLNIPKENFKKLFLFSVIVSSVIFFTSIANELMFSVLKANFDSVKLIVWGLLFFYSLVICIKSKFLTYFIYTIIFAYVSVFCWNLKQHNFKPLNNYQKMKKEIWKEVATWHFPEDIPLNAKNVEYDYYQNSFFGGENIYLVFTTDINYINDELKKYKYNEIIEPKEYNGNYDYTYRTIGYEMGNFKIYTIYRDGNCSFGFAVNEQTNQFMYFYSNPD